MVGGAIFVVTALTGPKQVNPTYVIAPMHEQTTRPRMTMALQLSGFQAVGRRRRAGGSVSGNGTAGGGGVGVMCWSPGETGRSYSSSGGGGVGGLGVMNGLPL